jgi:hypothetical protein
MKLPIGSSALFGLCFLLLPAAQGQQKLEQDVTEIPMSHAAVAAKAPTTVTTTGGSVGRVPLFTGTSAIGNSLIFQGTSGIGIGAAPTAAFDVNGRSVFHGTAAVVPARLATASLGANSSSVEFVVSVFDSASQKAMSPVFQLRAEPTNNNTNHSGANLHLLYGTGLTTPRDTGLAFNSNGTINFSPAQKFPIAAGPAGPQGSAGPAGPVGATGPTGPQGPAGTLTLPFAGSGSAPPDNSGAAIFSVTNLSGRGTGVVGRGGPATTDPIDSGGTGVIGYGGDGETGGYGVVGYGGQGETQGYGVVGIAGGAQAGAGGYFDAGEGLTAGIFVGDVEVQGNLSKASGSFKIDDPVDPSNKYLYHSFVESPDMKNIYDGNITTDGRGDAVVTMPAYFEALNRDFRYQLTVVGQFAQAIVATEISNGSFLIKTDRPNVKVSWQVTGIRQDAWANAHRIPNEVEKPEKEKGRYLHPELFGKSNEARIAPQGITAFKEKKKARF